MFRSREMGYYNIVMPREGSWEVLNELGTLSALQFLDLNQDETAFNRPYSGYVRRCEEMENKISVIEKEMQKFDKRIERADDVNGFLSDLKQQLRSRNKSDHTYFDDCEAELDGKMNNLNEQIKVYDNLIEKFNHLIEYKQVLLKTRPFTAGDGGFNQSIQEETKGNDTIGMANRDIRFHSLAGVINNEDALRFKRILFRVTRGMAYTQLIDIEKAENPSQQDDLSHLISEGKDAKNKAVFLIVYQGGQHDMLKAKLNKICDSFGASKYGIPEDSGSFNKKL
mmetsp:Transcript_20061/g.17151  ORF Transcript_20061/g.17151 Transcript_20061/m.17151 type:complete len:282 (+) Transcript_20061:55-900(+)